MRFLVLCVRHHELHGVRMRTCVCWGGWGGVACHAMCPAAVQPLLPLSFRTVETLESRGIVVTLMPFGTVPFSTKVTASCAGPARVFLGPSAFAPWLPYAPPPQRSLAHPQGCSCFVVFRGAVRCTFA